MTTTAGLSIAYQGGRNHPPCMGLYDVERAEHYDYSCCCCCGSSLIRCYPCNLNPTALKCAAQCPAWLHAAVSSVAPEARRQKRTCHWTVQVWASGGLAGDWESFLACKDSGLSRSQAIRKSAAVARWLPTHFNTGNLLLWSCLRPLALTYFSSATSQAHG